MDTTSPNRFSNALDSFARFILVGLVAVLPLFVLPFNWAAVSQSKILLIVGVVILVSLVWALSRLFEGEIRIPRSALLYAGLLLVLAYIVSAGFAGWPANSLVGQGIEQDTLAAVIVFYALFAFTALLFTGRTTGMRTLVRALALGMTALFSIQALYIFFPSYVNLGILSGLTSNALGSWHDLGILSGLALFLSVGLFRSGLFSGMWRFPLIALGILSVFFLVVIHFNDVLWGAAALMALGFLAALRSGIQSDGLSFTSAALRSIALLVLSVALGLAALFGVSVWEKLPAPIQISEIEVRPSWQGTFDVGRQSLGAPASLLFGTGPNSFIREWGAHKPEGVNTTPFWNSDFSYGVGIIPTSIFTAGLVGTLAWLSLVVVILALFLRFVREVRPLSPGRTLFGFLLVSVAYLIVFHMIYTPGIALTGITFLLLGLLAVVVAGDRPSRVLSTGSMTGAVVFALVLLCAVPVTFAAGLIGREVISNTYVNRASSTFNASGSVADAHALLDTAFRISSRNDRAHRAAAELGLVEFTQLANQGNAENEEMRTKLQETLQKTIQHGLTAVSIDDANYQNWLILAQVYGSLAGANVEGAYEQAKINYERAFVANPSNPVPKLRLAQLAIAKNDLPGGREYLQEAIALKPDFAAALFILSQVEAASGNGDAAVQSAVAAVQIVPDDPLGWFNLGYILYSGGIFNDAAAALEQAIVRAPDYSNAMFFLGISYYQLQRPNDAVVALQRVLQLNPNETWLQEGISDIQAGRTPFAEEQATSTQQ